MSPEREYLSGDAWLADLFGHDVYRLVLSDAASANELDGLCQQVRGLLSARVFMYAKVPPMNMAAVERLEMLGFHLVDTNVLFAKALGGSGRQGEPPSSAATPAASGDVRSYVVRSAVAEDREQTIELARRSFSCSRFHLDPAIPKTLADEIKARWVDNFFAGARGDSMVVASHGETIVGFCLLLHGGDGALTIDLIAVDAAHRGRGLAGEIAAFVERRPGGFTEIRVGTQIANTASIRCYERLGFRLRSAQYVLHYHNPPRGKR